MTPFWQDDHLALYGGDCREVMASMEPESVHCVVTSPPYWGLRDYGTDGQIGLEPTPEEYVADMIAVFREVRRVLRADGTLWLNLGDTYASTGGEREYGSSDAGTGRGPGTRRYRPRVPADAIEPDEVRRLRTDSGSSFAQGSLKPKDLVGIPWRVAFALQADGWYLRSDIIWSKPNPMPESVTDRPTKAHEYLFLLSKSPRYYYDADAVREGFADERMGNPGGGSRNYAPGDRNDGTDSRMLTWDKGAERGGRNLRSVWTIATEPYPGAHFATFPRKLVEPCVKAGCPEGGVCPECGAPWERVVEVERKATEAIRVRVGDNARPGPMQSTPGVAHTPENFAALRTTTGWRPSCTHDAEPVPASVLDPFAGSGTTLLVAQTLGRRGVGIDLNPDYLKQALVRNAQTPLGLVG